MFLMLMKKGTELSGFKRYVMPLLGVCGCLFMVYAAFAGYGMTVFFYLIVFAVFMVAGNCLYRKK
jgi:APA family basic amino acid/polyamine antiporter